MGIPGLTPHVVSRRLVPKRQFHDRQIIVDGNHFFHLISDGLDNSYGGEFHDIAARTDKFLNDLAQCNIVPVFVYIGTHDRDSRERLLQKNEDRINSVKRYFQSQSGGVRNVVFPILGRLAFNNVLLEHGVQQVTTEHVDEVTAVTALANKLHCSVMSSNSEYLVSNVHEGVILVHNLGKLTKFDNGKFVAPLYQINEFIRHNRLSGPFDAALVAAGVKYYDRYKDEYSSEIPAPSGNRQRKVEELINTVRAIRAGSHEESIRILAEHLEEDETDECQEYLKKITDLYRSVEDSALFDFLQDDANLPRIESYDGLELPQWFRKAWMAGDMPRYLCSIVTTKEVNLPCQMEDVNQPCSFDCSEKIRQVSYGILTSGSDPGLTEYRRTVDKPTFHQIQPKFELDGYGQLPRLSEVPRLTDRRKLVMKALELGEDWPNSLDEFDDDWLLFVAICSYWNGKARPSREHVRALLLCAIKLRIRDRIMGEDADKTLRWFKRRATNKRSDLRDPSPVRGGTERADLQHSFCQWQACFIDTNQMNELLLQPFSSARPELCFSGCLAYRYLKDLMDGKGVGDFLGEDGRYREFFDKFLTIIERSE